MSLIFEGKWLIGRSPETPGNRVARRVLSGVNWGYGEDGELWMHKQVHVMCADVVVKVTFPQFPVRYHDSDMKTTNCCFRPTSLIAPVESLGTSPK